MTRRITRAKKSIKDSRIPFRMPPAAERADRLGAVLHVLYLIFNEGYVSTSGPSLHRAELSAEAIRLTRIVHRLMPDDVEVTGLLALMVLTDARRPARTAPDGALIPMAEQDRSRWNSGDIAEGVALISGALPRGTPGPYQLQAAIAAIHDEAPTAEATDWPQIVALYELLLQLYGQPGGGVEPRRRGRHGARPGRRSRAAGRTGHRRRGSPGTTGCTPSVPTCWSWPAITMGRRSRYRVAAGRTTSLPVQRYLYARAARLSADD